MHTKKKHFLTNRWRLMRSINLAIMPFRSFDYLPDLTDPTFFSLHHQDWISLRKRLKFTPETSSKTPSPQDSRVHWPSTPSSTCPSIEWDKPCVTNLSEVGHAHPPILLSYISPRPCKAPPNPFLWYDGCYRHCNNGDLICVEHLLRKSRSCAQPKRGFWTRPIDTCHLRRSEFAYIRVGRSNTRSHRTTGEHDGEERTGESRWSSVRGMASHCH